MSPEMVGVAVQLVGLMVKVDPFKVVAAPALPKVSPDWVVVPIPKVPEALVSMVPFAWVRIFPLTSSAAPGLLVPIPTLPLFAMYRAVFNPAFPPTEVSKLRDPPFSTLKVSAGAVPVVGTTKERLPEILAVGDPAALLIKANLAEEVEVPPNKRSAVLLNGERAPLFNCQ
jgi:hypothetical protein